MFTNRPIVISGRGYMRMQLSHEFERKGGYAETVLHLRNPWRVQRNAIRGVQDVTIINGKEVPCTRIEHVDPGEPLPTTEEIDNYIAEREKFLDIMILHYFPWDSSLRNPESLHPCQGSDGQCNIFCKDWQKCQDGEPIEFEDIVWEWDEEGTP